MKLLTVDLDLDCLEFVDRLGIIRTVWGCSQFGLIEFEARLSALLKLLDEAPGSTTIASFYRSHQIFRHHCHRCLELNGVDPDWLDNKGHLLNALLLSHEGGPGLLVRLNAMPSPSQKGEPATVYDLAGALLGLSNDLEQVLHQLETLPAKQVAKTLEARAKQLAKADSGTPQARKDWAAEMRKRPKPILVEAG